MKRPIASLSLMMTLAMVVAACSGEKPPAEHPVPSVSTSALTAKQPSEKASAPSSSPSASASASVAAGGGDEDSAQGVTNPGDNHPLPTYGSLEEVAAYPKGVFTSKTGPSYLEEGVEVQAVLEKYFRTLGDGTESVDDQAEHIYTKLLYLFAADYSDFKPLKKYAYVLFQGDKADPVTTRPVADGAQVNLELVLDASGSMAKQIDGRSMMDIAKESISKTIQQLPPNANVALRVYGHKGNNKAAGKAESCASSELIQPMGPVNAEAINAQLAPIAPTGWTHLATSISSGGQDFAAHQGENQVNILYVVSDGIETCDGDPIAAAANLKQLSVKPVLGIIGFNVDPTQELNLKQIAQAGEGHYAGANNADTLVKELAEIHALANSQYDWKPLDEFDVLKVSNALQFDAILKPSNDLQFDSLKEYNELIFAVQKLKFRFTNDHDVLDKVQQLIEERHSTIERFRGEAVDARNQERDQMLNAYRAKLGQPAVVIIPD